jgi:hypothetical protein
MTSKERFLTRVFNNPPATVPQYCFHLSALAVEQAFGVMSGLFLDPWTRRHFPKIF